MSNLYTPLDEIRPDQPAPTPRTDALIADLCIPYVDGAGEDLSSEVVGEHWREAWQKAVDEVRQTERELSAVREALTGEDYASLPSDIPTVRMAHEIRSDRDKFLQQVRDTCSRAEKSERELSRSREDCERLREALIQGTHSHIDHARDLLAELKPLHWHFCDIHVRINGEWKVHQGDWLKRLMKLRDAALSTTRKEEGNG